MSAYDKWEVAGVIPGDYEDYGDWVMQRTTSNVTDSPTTGILYHKHFNAQTQKPTLFMIDTEGACRECGKDAPRGMLFRAKTLRFEDVK